MIHFDRIFFLLLQSAALGETGCVRNLLLFGANKDLIDHEGKTAVEMAGKRRALNRNYAEIVDLLCCSEEIDGEKEKETDRKTNE